MSRGLSKERKHDVIVISRVPKNHRATDHIFILFSLIKKSAKKVKYRYTCFIEFSKDMS